MPKGLGLLKGLKETLKHAAARPRVTVQYPEQKRFMPARARWRHILRRYEDPNDPNRGLERCIG